MKCLVTIQEGGNAENRAKYRLVGWEGAGKCGKNKSVFGVFGWLFSSFFGHPKNDKH